MSRSAAILWILIAGALALAVWGTTPGALRPSAGGPFLPGFSASATDRVVVRWPDGATATIARGPLDGMWLFRVGEGDDAGSPWWPAEPARVQGLLRLLGDIRQNSVAVQTAMPKAVFLDVYRTGASVVHLAIDPSTLGGKGRLALLNDSSAVVGLTQVGEDFVRALERSSVSAWRVTDLFPLPPETGVSLAIRSSGATIELARAGSAWVMQLPIQTRAEPSVVQGGLLLLSKTVFERFLPMASEAESGLSPPQRELVIGARSGTVRLEEHIEIGASPDGQSRIVRVTAISEGSGTPVWGPMLGMVDSASLAAFGEDPGAYVSRTCVGVPASDIAGIEFGTGEKSITIRRTSAGGFGESDGPIRDLLRLLCETPAAVCTIRTSEAAEPATEVVRIRLLGARGESLAELTLKASSIASKVVGSSSTPALEVVDGSIVRLIPAPRPRELLASLRSPKAQP